MDNVTYQLPLGTFHLYPTVGILDPNPPTNVYPLGPTGPFATLLDVIQYYTASSLLCEGFQTLTSLQVTGNDVQGDPVTVTITMADSEQPAVTSFAMQHYNFLVAGQQAQNGAQTMMGTPA